MKNKYITLLKNMGLFFIASFVPKTIAFFLVPLYTYCLSTEDYGTVDLLTHTVQLLIPFLTFQVQDAVLRFSMDPKYDKNEVFSNGLIITLRGGLILIAGAAVCAITHVITMPITFWLFFVITYFTGSLNSIFSYFCRGIGKIKILTLSSITMSIVTVSLNILFLLKLKMGLEGYLLANSVGALVNIIIIYFGAGLKRFTLLKIKSQTVYKEMVRFSIPMIFSAISWWINNASDRYILTFFSGVSVVGIYAVSSKIPTIISTLSSVVSRAYSISAIKELDVEDKDGFLGRSYAIIGFCSVLGCSLLMIANIGLARILFSKDFFVAWQFVPPLLISALMNQLSLSCENLLIALKNTRLVSVTAIIAAATNTVFNFILIPLFGAYGAAIATVIGFTLQWVLRFRRIKRIVKLKNETVKEIISYLLLMVQMIIAYYGNDFIAFQIVILATIVVMYHKELLSILRNIKKRLPNR